MLCPALKTISWANAGTEKRKRATNGVSMQVNEWLVVVVVGGQGALFALVCTG